jgi:ERCC4-type nuclease
VDVKGRGEIQKELAEQIMPEIEAAVSVAESPPPIPMRLADLPGVGEKLADRLIEAGLDSYQKLAHASEEVLVQVEGVGPKTAQKLIEVAKAALASRDTG